MTDLKPVTLARDRFGTSPISLELNGDTSCTVNVAIPQFDQRVRNHYATDQGSKDHDPPFQDFGLVLTMNRDCLLNLLQSNETLDPTIKPLLQKYGALIIRRARLEKTDTAASQRNIFPNLKFHYDRTISQGNYYSLFFRDPEDPSHCPPRTSSTLITSNAVIQLEAQRSGQWNGHLQPWYDLFQNTDVKNLTGDILLEQTWSEPEGTGEIVILDNSTVMHASYYRQSKGYPIGVRYLY
ncbi:hypothetical protein [Aestuariispira insulae]|uniref:TauD/TfdA-like domain-containing protein n=1 Tax=Aestuariispira insulae TaxID=1461337 RepID=A0A3D9HUQ5_9PROT|nr:hypothetical protein [Aestuariispira insulae]RED53243.1 hypothetical protein DFP90_10125 [Aestuariispira insulae]